MIYYFTAETIPIVFDRPVVIDGRYDRFVELDLVFTAMLLGYYGA